MPSADDGYDVTLLYYVALCDSHLGHRGVRFTQNRDLHLHRLEDDQGVACGDRLAGAHEHLPHIGDHLCAYCLGHPWLPASDASSLRGPPTDGRRSAAWLLARSPGG